MSLIKDAAFGRSRWVSEILFIITALITGVNTQLNWFTTSVWRNGRVELYDFARDGEWEKQIMTSRSLRWALLMVLVFYFLRLLSRFVVSRFPSLWAIKADYLKYDKLLYPVFLLTSLGFFGVYLDVFSVFFLFIIGQLFLIYRLALKEEKKTAQDSGAPSAGRIFRLFFISGFAALIYQISWQRVLFQFYGVNIESVTIIVSLFMFGLGIGSIAGGLLSKRFPDHLPHLFIACELVIGVFGVFSLKLIGAVGSITLYKNLLGVSLTIYALLSIPTIFMGATLPILVSFFYKGYKNIGKTVSLLYFINTLGSAVASFFTVFVLFVYFGVQAAVIIAAAFNFVVVYFGYQFIRENKPVGPDDAPRDQVESRAIRTRRDFRSRLRYASILLLAAATGFVSMSQEILWIRYISYTTGGEASVFAVLLGFILLGIAFGSLKAKAVCEKYRDNVLSIVGLVLLFSALSYFLLLPLLARLLTMTPYTSLVVIFMYISAGFIAFLIGAIFPMLTHYAIKSDRAVGFSLSWIYFFDILGSTAGPLFTGFFLLEWLTFEQNVLLISLVTLILGVLLWLSSLKSSPYKNAYVLVLSLAVIGSLLFHNNLYFHLFERLYFKNKYTRESHFRYSIQNRSGIIDVVRSQTKDDIITGGGIYDGRFNTSLLRNQNVIDRAYAFAALHLRPESVLEIGLSSGSWARVLANDPEVKSLDIVEINPGYLKLLPHYRENNSILMEKEIQIHIDDGRRWLLRHDKKFDFILMNTTYYWRSEINNLISKEFLLLCKDHLKPGGVLYYNTTGSRDIPFTAAQVFRYVVRYKSFIAASDSRFPQGFKKKRDNLLKFASGGKPVFDLENETLKKVLDELASIDTRNKKQEILKKPDGLNFLTDDNLGSEFKTGKKFYSKRRKWMPLLRLFSP